MERSELKVGDKIIADTPNVVVIVTAIGEEKFLGKYEKKYNPNDEQTWSISQLKAFKPYKEPVVHKVWVHFYKNRYNNNRPSFTVHSETPEFPYHNKDIYPHITLLKTVEVTYTEET